MADIKCAVCGEPWDAYGVRYGDMAPWEAKLFRAGAGCPCCKGVVPPGGDHVEDHMKSLILDGAADDPDSFVLTTNPEAKRPKWERPPDPVLFQCAGCDSRMLGNQDFAEDSEFYRYWVTPSATRDRYAHRDRSGEMVFRWSTDLDDLYEIDSKKYCAACADTCDDCGKAVFCTNTSATGTVLFGDTYDPGASHCDPRDCHDTICTDCLEAIATCGHCGQPLEDFVEYLDEAGDYAKTCCGPVLEADDGCPNCGSALEKDGDLVCRTGCESVFRSHDDESPAAEPEDEIHDEIGHPVG